MKSIGVVAIIVIMYATQVVAQQEGHSAAGLPGDTEYGKIQDLPDSEKQRKASEYLSEMKGALGHVLALLKEAREEKDVIKINCINEKLTNIKGLIRISEQADILLQENVAKGEKEASAHEFQKIIISHQKVLSLRTEAEQCVGELAFAVGRTKVEVEKDKNLITDDDPTDEELPKTQVVRPPVVSPFQ